MNAKVIVVALALVLAFPIPMGIWYLSDFEPVTRSKHSGIDNPSYDNDDSLSDEVKERWKLYSKHVDLPEIITIDPGIAKAKPGEELERLAQLEGQTNFTDTNERAIGDKTVNTVGGKESNGSAEGSAEREVEEADIVKVIGNTIYVLNRYRGLIIIDISEPEKAYIAGRCSVIGYPVEMYVIDLLAIITVRTNYNFWYKYWDIGIAEGEDKNSREEGTIGTMIYILNVENPAHPRILKIVELKGFAVESRRVGHVIYQATNTYGWYWYYDSDKAETIVTSIDFGDPKTVGMRDQVRFNGSSNQVHASPTAFYVAQPEWVDKVVETTEKPLWNYPFDSKYEYYTNVAYLDISDPNGDIVLRDSFKVPGQLHNKYQMDEYKHMFRMVTHFWNRIGESRLYILDISNPDDIKPLGSLLVDDAGSLMATRFAGERAYTIHLPRSIDPLDVLDLSDPTNPKLCDVFEMPGWVTHMEVRGNKIIALGVDDSEGNRNVAVSLFDVRDPYDVKMLDRVRLGGDYAYSSANWEPKALTIDDSHKIIIVPFNSWSKKDRKNSAGVQIVSFELDVGELKLRGSVYGSYSIDRTRVVSDWILATSFKSLQVINIKNLDKPKVVRVLDLCVNIMDIVPFGDMFIQMTSDWYDGKVVLRSVKEPDDLEPMGTVLLDSNFARIFDGPCGAILVADVHAYGKTFGNLYKINVDMGGKITITPSGQLPEGYTFSKYSNYYGRYSYYYKGRDRFALIDNALVYYHLGAHSYTRWVYDEETGKYLPTPEKKGTDTLFLFDISDMDNVPSPTMLEVETYSFMGMSTWKNMVYIEHQMTGVKILNESGYYRHNYEWYYKSYALAIDCSDISAPSVVGDYNIPGKIIGAGNNVVFTISKWNSKGKNVTLSTLTLHDNIAELTSAIKVGTGWVDAVVYDDRAYLVDRPYYGYYYLDYDNHEANTSFRVIDLSVPNSPSLLASFTFRGVVNIEKIEKGHIVFYNQYLSSVMVYSTASLPEMDFEAMVLLKGYGGKVRVYENAIYIPQGYYGVVGTEL